MTSYHGKSSKYADLEARVADQANTITHLSTVLDETKTRVEGLEQELSTVCSLVHKLVSNINNHAEEDKTGGGRIAVSRANLGRVQWMEVY